MPDADRYKISVRSKRAYAAGFGSSGSLLAAAAALFVIGSAIVAFQGWPQISAGPATSDVSGTPIPVASRDARRLNVVLALARRHGLTRSGASRGTGPAHHGSVRGVRTVPQTGAPQAGSGAPGTGSPVSGGSSGGSSGATESGSACGSCGSPTPQKQLGNVTNSITDAVSTVGSDVGQQITGLSSKVAQPVSAVSPPAGNVVSSAGSSAGNTVTDTVTSAANGVSTTVNNLLGGGH